MQANIVVGGEKAMSDDDDDRRWHSPSREPPSPGSVARSVDIDGQRWKFGGSTEGGGRKWQRGCYDEEERDRGVDMGFKTHFSSTQMGCAWHSGVSGYDVDSQVMPEVSVAQHYGDKQHAAFDAKTIGNEVQELILMATYYSRFLNEAMHMSKKLFPVSEEVTKRMRESIAKIEKMQKLVAAVIGKLKKEGKDSEAVAIELLLQTVVENHKLQVQNQQLQQTTTMNLERIMQPVSRMLTVLRNVLIKLPKEKGRASEKEKQTGEEKEKKKKIDKRSQEVKDAMGPKHIDSCTTEQLVQYQRTFL